MPQEKERILDLLERYDELHRATHVLKNELAKLSAQIPTTQQTRTEEYSSVKQAEQAVRAVEGRVAEARRKVRSTPLLLRTYPHKRTARCPPPPFTQPP